MGCSVLLEEHFCQHLCVIWPSRPWFVMFNYEFWFRADVNECAESTDECESNEACANRPGGYKCECATGYESNEYAGCKDVNECSRNTYACEANSRCFNTEGSYQCACANGFRRNNSSQCEGNQPRRQAGGVGELSPPQEAPSSPNWNMKRYKSVEFLLNFVRVLSPSAHTQRSPLKTFWRWFWM